MTRMRSRAQRLGARRHLDRARQPLPPSREAPDACSAASASMVASWLGSATTYLIPCELVTAPDADRPAAHGRPGGRGAAPGGRQGHAGRGALRLRAALQSRGAAPRRRTTVVSYPQGLRAPERLASPPGRAGRDPRLPRLRRPVPATNTCTSSSIRTTGRTLPPSSTITSSPTRPGTAISTCCRS